MNASPMKRPPSRPSALVPEPVLGQEALLAAQTVLICSAAFFLADVSKCLALKSATLVYQYAYTVAGNPWQASLLAAIAAWLLIDRQGKAAQLATAVQMAMLGAIALAPTAKGLPTGAAQLLSSHRLQPLRPASPVKAQRGAGSSGSSSSSGSCSSRGAGGRQRRRAAGQRWSFDVAPGQAAAAATLHFTPKPRTSVDFEVRAPATPRLGQGQAAAESGGGGCEAAMRHHDVPALADLAAPGGSAGQSEGPPRRSVSAPSSPRPARRQRAQAASAQRWEPRMHRIASGQELADLASRGAHAESAFAAAAGRDPAQRQQQPGAAAAAAAAGAAGGAPGAWRFSRSLSWGEAAAAAVPAASDATQWLARQGAEWAGWASGRVDALLGPLIPGTKATDGHMQRSASAPASGGAGGFEALRDPAPLLAPPAAGRSSAGRGGRRGSVEGARHYTGGGIVAGPGRREPLERLACAARLQQQSSGGGGSAAARLGGGGGQPGRLSLVPAGGQGPLGPDAGRSALASVGLDGDCPQYIREQVTDEHLLQFGAVLGEEASAKALEQVGAAGAWGSPDSLFGVPDTEACIAGGWERVVREARPGLQYEAYRLPLRSGLYMYRSRAVLEGVAPRDVRPFHLDDTARHLWDEAAIEIRRVQPAPAASTTEPFAAASTAAPAAAGRGARLSEWAQHRYRSRFPRPMAAREYNYVRRVWHRPADGGCYAICRACDVSGGGAAAPEDGFRAVQVGEFVSSFAIRACEGGAGGVGTELVGCYFEDSGVRAGLAKMAVPKGLWPYIQKYDAALRVFAAARREVSGRTPAQRRCSLEAARRSQEEREEEEGTENSGATSDDSLRGAYTALKRRLRPGGAGRAGEPRQGARARVRWARHIVLAAGIKMLHAIIQAK